MSVTPAAFSAALTPLWPSGATAAAVAVSGGPDSLALALLAAAWAKEQGVALTALTVDHGLRPESATEAGQVGRWLADRRIPHQTLRWDGVKPTANIQAIARQARYDLLASWCRAHGVSVLLLGHHADDQIETFLLRLGRGSGLRGLSGMRPVTACAGVTVLRPLLDFSKADLQATVAAAGQAWLEDPSNHHPHFSRSQVRDLAAQLPAAGISAQRVLLAVRNLQRASDAIDTLVAERLRLACDMRPEGYAVLSEAALEGPDELALRTLAAVLQMVGGKIQTGRLDALEALLTELRQAQRVRRTLQGCGVVREAAGALRVWRELADVAPRTDAVDGMIWDSRFRITLAADAAGLQIGALGTAGWQQIRADLAAPCRVPYPVRLALPALWQGEKILSVSHLGWARPEWTDSCTAVFAPLCHPTIFKGPELTYI